MVARAHRQFRRDTQFVAYVTGNELVYPEHVRGQKGAHGEGPAGHAVVPLRSGKPPGSRTRAASGVVPSPSRKKDDGLTPWEGSCGKSASETMRAGTPLRAEGKS